MARPSGIEIGSLIDRDPKIRGGRPKRRQQRFTGRVVGQFDLWGRQSCLQPRLAAPQVKLTHISSLPGAPRNKCCSLLMPGASEVSIECKTQVGDAGHRFSSMAMTPMALAAILKRSPFRSTVETGCGGSTMILSHASYCHTAFAIEGKDGTITELRKQRDLRSERVIFVEGETKDTL